MKLLTESATRCWLLRSESSEMLRGFVTAWRAWSLTVLVAPRAGLRLNEGVIVSVDQPLDYATNLPAHFTRLDSRVVSILWHNSGDLVGLSIRTVETPDGRSSEYQLANRVPPESVS